MIPLHPWRGGTFLDIVYTVVYTAALVRIFGGRWPSPSVDVMSTNTNANTTSFQVDGEKTRKTGAALYLLSVRPVPRVCVCVCVCVCVSRSFMVDGDTGRLSFQLPELSVAACFRNRQPWSDKRPNGAGPEGWLQRTGLLPLHYWVVRRGSSIVRIHVCRVGPRNSSYVCSPPISFIMFIIRSILQRKNCTGCKASMFTALERARKSTELRDNSAGLSDVCLSAATRFDVTPTAFHGERSGLQP